MAQRISVNTHKQKKRMAEPAGREQKRSALAGAGKSAAVTRNAKAALLSAAPKESPRDAAKGAPAVAPAPTRERKAKLCAEPGCLQPQMNDHFCRLHYIKNWGSIINGRRAQARANLNKYIESLSEKYPEEYMEKIRDDFGNDAIFHARLRELGFREEYESGGDNPFQIENFDELVHGLKFED